MWRFKPTHADTDLQGHPNILQFVPVLRDLTVMRCLMGQETMGLQPCELIYESIEKQQASPGWLEEQYEKHNAKVRAKVSKERLLEFTVQDGWEPLCRFLNVPIPDVAFPHVNDSASMWRMGIFVQVLVYGWLPSVMLLLLMLWRCCGASRKSEGDKTE